MDNFKNFQLLITIGLIGVLGAGCQEREKPDDMLKKSAFSSKRKKTARGPSGGGSTQTGDPYPDPTTTPIPSPTPNPSAPPQPPPQSSMTISTKRFCSTMTSNALRTNLVGSQNLKLVFRTAEGNFVKSVDATNVRNQILDRNQFTLNFDNAGLPPGEYRVGLCDESVSSNHCAVRGESQAMGIGTIPAPIRDVPGHIGSLFDARGFRVNIDSSGNARSVSVTQKMTILTAINPQDWPSRGPGGVASGDPYPEPSQTPSPSPSPAPEEPPVECDETRSPLMIDLDDNGIDLTAPASNGVRFDIDGDKREDLISWPRKKDDAFLVWDRNKNRQIDDVNEMFGDNTVGPDLKKSPNGFIALGKHDSNHDKVIDSHDPIYKYLEVWKDANHDGYADAGELVSLVDADIKSISLIVTEGPKDDEDAFGNEHKQRSLVTTFSNKVHLIVDIWFRPAPENQ